MTAHLEDALASEFPFMSDILIDCGDGWYQLIQEMCGEIARAHEAVGKPVDIVFYQIKEKYGQLRVYCCSRNCRIEDILDRYEEKSACVCDVCGRPGHLRTDLRWHQALCEEHYEQKKARA